MKSRASRRDQRACRVGDAFLREDVEMEKVTGLFEAFVCELYTVTSQLGLLLLI
jgi:hypothetical protein